MHVVKQTKFLLTKLTAIQVQRNFYPTKITRYIRYYEQSFTLISLILMPEITCIWMQTQTPQSLVCIKKAFCDKSMSARLYRTMWKDWPGETLRIRREHRQSADPGNRKGGFQTIECEARGVKSAQILGVTPTSGAVKLAILSQGKSHLRLRGTAANSQLAWLGTLSWQLIHQSNRYNHWIKLQ